jgi:septal ring-binding cell division protein DamX
MDQSRRSIALLAAAVLLVVVIVGGIARIAARRSARQSEATTVPVPSSDTTPQRAAADSTTASLTPVAQFVVQFVATRSIDTAHVVAARVRAPAGAAQILSEMKDGRPLYRVILGPYPTSATADSVGRAAHTAYWVRQAP